MKTSRDERPVAHGPRGSSSADAVVAPSRYPLGTARLAGVSPRPEETLQEETRPDEEELRRRLRERRVRRPEEPDPRAGEREREDEPTAPSERAAEPIEPVPHFEPMEDRWSIEPPPYEVNEPGSLANPYRQNVLKGDYPVIGEDIFLNVTATDKLLVEANRLPVPSGITGNNPNNQAFFGDPDVFLFQNFGILEADLFKGQQAFKPVDWRLRAAVAYNQTYLDVEEVGVVNVDVDDGRTRYTDFVALQEALAEVHLFDLSDRYDFVSLEAGILPFRSDFRGFVFDDVNLGARIFGNYDENKWQFNIAAFDMLEKETNSELNRFRDRDQYVVAANVFRQDFIFLGYTASLSFHYSHDDDEVHFDRNGFLARPKPVGFARPHEVDAYYLGWAGEGHIGRVNVTHAFYQVLGEEEDNEFAARDTKINAQLAALELSYDIDWVRLRAFGMFASGDDDTRDNDAEGFDSIIDAPNFAGGPFSFFNRQAVRLLGVNLTQRLSPLPDLRTSKFEGQSNFVNPGLYLIGGAVDFEITPTWRAQVGASYLSFVETDPLETFLQVEDVDEDLGTEIFVGTQYRPLLTNNVIFVLGFSPFFPGEGFKKIYQSSEVLVSSFLEATFTF